MRLLALVTDSYGGYGGIAQYNRDLLDALACAPGVASIELVALSGDPVTDVPVRVHVRHASRSKARFLVAAVAALRARPDAIYCGHINLSPVAWLVARCTGARYWLQLHGIDAWNHPGERRARASARADLVTVVSRYTRRRFLSWARIAPGRVRVLPNTVSSRYDLGPFPEGLARDLDLVGRRVLLTVSRIAKGDRYKGHAEVLNAVSRLVREFPDLVYLIVGSGDARADLEQMVDQAGIRAHVRLLGAVPPEELPEYFRLADVFVMPSSKEGFGIVYLEAMRCGTPSIGLDVDGSTDPLVGMPLGFAVPMETLVDCLAETLRAGRRSDDDRARSRTAVDQRFGRENFQALVDRIVRELDPFEATVRVCK